MSDLRAQLQQIYDSNGFLTPDLVVETARDETHPLHSRFNWDDRSAAESWRREQAHQLIRTARIVYRLADDKSGERTIRAFHAVPSSEGHVYEPAEKIAGDPFQRQLVINDMKREWQQLKRRYEQFAEFLDLVRGDVPGPAGPAGTPGAAGTPGTPGTPGQAGAPGKNGEVIRETVIRQSPPIVIREAPTPRTVTSDDGYSLPAVTH